MTSFNFSFKDITTYFVSSCCQSSDGAISSNAEAEEYVAESLVRTLPKLRFTTEIKECLIHLAGQNTCFSPTITIGNKYYGRLSAQTQYKHFVKAIKGYLPYHGEIKYIFTFELQANGQLHAHGFQTGGFQARFIEACSKFGRRNSHDASFQRTKHIPKYLDYINKEPVFPYITNIMKKDIRLYNKWKKENPPTSLPQGGG